MDAGDDRRFSPEARLGAFLGRAGLRVGWTRTNKGDAAKVCDEAGRNGWKNAQLLPTNPDAAAGFFVERLKRRNPVIPAGSNALVLWDGDDGPLDDLARLYGLEIPAGAWRVRTPGGGEHAYTSAPAGRPGLKVELTAERVVVSADGYLVGPGATHPNGKPYPVFEGVDLENGTERPPAVSHELLGSMLELTGRGRAQLGELVDRGDPIEVGDRHAALRHHAGRLRGEGLGRKAILAALEELAERFAEPLEDARELLDIVEWIMRKPAPVPLNPVELELLALLDDLVDLAPAPRAGSEKRQVGRVGPWEWPVPLRDRLPVPPFPLEVLPGWQREWAVAISKEKGACVDLAATLSLGVVAGGVARSVVVEPRAGWIEPLNLYLATGLDPGQRKTPSFKAAIRPVRALERLRILEWEENARLTSLSEEIYNKRRRELIGESADDDELSPELLAERAAALYEGLGETKQPPKPRLLTEDITPEGLASLLADHGRVIAASDEGAILFENFAGRYTHGSANWDLLNKAHSAGDLIIDRKTSGTVFVWDPALTLVLATQPRVLSDLWGKPGTEARGVLARPLYTLPDPVYATGRTPAAGAGVLAEYERRVRALYEDVPILMLDADERPLPVALRFDPAAERLFERYELELALERRELGTSDDVDGQAAYLGWLSKFAGQTARLAACLHAAEHWTDGSTVNVTIGAGTVSAAIELGRYFHGHARVVFGLMGELPDQRRANAVLGWLRSRSVDELGALTVRDVHRTRGKRTTAAEVRAALRVLEDHGYIRVERPSTERRGRRAEIVHVNPAIYESFAIDPTNPTETISVGPVGPDANDSEQRDGSDR